jgi:hypothetical protein
MLFRTSIKMTIFNRLISLVWLLALAITPAAASDTSTTICALSADHSKVIRWNAATSTWNQIGGAASAIYGGPIALLATNPDNNAVFEYTSCTWTAIGNGLFKATELCTASHLTKGQSGNILGWARAVGLKSGVQLETSTLEQAASFLQLILLAMRFGTL